jgi:DNA-binding FadR family transcriptional regulator
MKPTEENIRDRSREAARDIRRFIEDGIATRRLKPGDKLPTERDLANTFATGRNTVRRTLVLLETEGKISRHVGRGTFIAAPPPEVGGSLEDSEDLSVVRIARATSPLDLMELRLSLEPNVAALCVQRASAAEIDRMQAVIEQSKSASDLQTFEDLDDDLHRAIALATRNPLFVTIATIITAVRAEAQWGVLKKRTLTDELRAKHTQEHVAIVDAIRRRDEEEARRAMETHLREVKAMMFGT